MLITIGKARKPWGVKGEIAVDLLTDFPERFRKLTSVVLVSPRGEEITCTVAGVRYLGGEPLLKLAGYDSPEQAKALNNWFIKIPEAEAEPLPEGQYYWFELIGMEVWSESGERLGVIDDIFETGSNDVYVMKRGGREVYLPATKEVIRQVDRKARRMTIHVMDGLLD